MSRWGDLREASPDASASVTETSAQNTGAPNHRVPSVEQVAFVYRQLADAYSAERGDANRERTWQRIELKRSLKKKSALVPRARVRWAGYSLAALAMAAVLALLVWPEDARVEYALEGGTLQEGWVVTGDQLATLAFTDGSELELGKASALSVDSLGPHSALSRLARGRVRVRVQHHEDTKWTFLAGPYEVRVLGTSFDLAWQSERFELTMHEGKVRVVGPDQREWVLEKGDALVVPADESARAQEPAAVAPPDEGGKAQAEPPSSIDVDEPAEAEQTSEVATTHGPTSAKPSNWTRLLKEGRFAEIVSDARKLGVKQALQRPIADVEALGQAARYTGDGGLSEDCWKAIRNRSPGSSSARQSAFFLGRVMEQQGRRSDAIQWFARYREESPGGVFAGQALGRQMVLTSGQGRGDAARSLARDYLARYPSGPYAKAARGVLGEKSQGSGASGRDDALSGE